MRWMLLTLLLIAPWAARCADYPSVKSGVTLAFPRDYGAHPDFRTEWWYVTGWLTDDQQRDLGFQVTFFRSRTGIGEDNPSAFAPRQILFAHAALSDPALGRLVHDQRIARAGFGLAQASESDMDIGLDGWTLVRQPDGRFVTHVAGAEFTLDLALAPTQPILEQGDHGVSHKGPAPDAASFYFSQPHLTVSGMITEGDHQRAVTGEAWLDREWSSSYMPPDAVGWDWIGVNLEDGGALMLFQMRDAAGQPIWAGGSLRDAAGHVTVIGPADIYFTALRSWRSPRTAVDYPVERGVSVMLKDGMRHFRLRPLFDDQELDSRASGGPIYWEGAARLETEDGSMVGRGYLELTGYAGKLSL